MLTIQFPHFLMSNFLCSFVLTVIFHIFPFKKKKISLIFLCCKLFSKRLPAALSDPGWRHGFRHAYRRTLVHPPSGWGFGARIHVLAGTAEAGQNGGTGLGGEVGGCPIAAAFFLTGAGAGTTDSSLALLLAGLPSSPPLTRSAVSFLAATLLALEVRWTPSTAQILVPSTVVRS
jgi:hypothetical protein